VTPLEQWLSDATRGLTAESGAQVRAEIQQHYDSACEAGDDALSALGDPRAANRAYRKVLLTEGEALMVPSVTQPKRPPLPAMLIICAWFASLVWMGLHSKHHDPGFLPVFMAMNWATLLTLFFLRTTIERIRIYAYILGVRSVLVVAIAWWYKGWISALVYGAMSLALLSVEYYFTYRAWLIFRKLGLRT